MQENEITKIVIDLCIKIHKALGPGLLESVYEEILVFELKKIGLSIARQLAIPVVYENIKMDLGVRADIMIEDKVIIELKSIDSILPVHKKQLLTYLKLTGKKVGLLINFNEALMKDGIVRIANGF
ncbi:MAG TPA: GxxExxY protein [Nitrospirota bacterium]|nr:GxxExxY protein [Nitrospirota bacterium]